MMGSPYRQGSIADVRVGIFDLSYSESLVMGTDSISLGGTDLGDSSLYALVCVSISVR